MSTSQGGERGVVRNRMLPVALGWVALAAGCGLAAQELVQEGRGHRQTPGVVPATAQRVQTLQKPEGFRVAVFARDLGAPRMLAVAANGDILVTRPDAGDVLALHDRDGDGRADGRSVIVRGLAGVHGIAVRGAQIFLATVDKVYVLDNGAGSAPRVIVQGLPPGGRHKNRTLGVGPDGALYLSVGSTCNACNEAAGESATLLRVSPETGERHVFARGLRNTIGFAWHPQTKALWGFDHGTDWLGDDEPPEELNRLERDRDYGWPFVNGEHVLRQAPSGGLAHSRPSETSPPVLGYIAHSAPMQMVFYEGRQFPAPYRGDAFVAMHGSWNRRPPAGYEIARVRFQAGEPIAIESFVSGFLSADGERTFGRPTGLTVAADGALISSDDATGVLYRVSFDGRSTESR